MAARTGRYELRCERYDAALEVMHGLGLDDGCTVVDVGSGWGEFGVRLHQGTVPPEWDLPLNGSRARYIPVDAAIDGTDLERWTPPRRADFFVALEVIEHLRYPLAFLLMLRRFADKGVIVSTPNPETTDVLGMDATHKTAVQPYAFSSVGFEVERRSFYGKPDDSLFATWRPDQ